MFADSNKFPDTNLTTIRHDYASVNGVRLHYAHAGEGRLILFLHGFPEFWYCWKKQLEEFGRDHHAVAPDLRGFNLSDRPADVKQYKARLLIEDIRQLAGHLGHEKFVLVAHDWGGRRIRIGDRPRFPIRNFAST